MRILLRTVAAENNETFVKLIVSEYLPNVGEHFCDKDVNYYFEVLERRLLVVDRTMAAVLSVKNTQGVTSQGLSKGFWSSLSISGDVLTLLKG